MRVVRASAVAATMLSASCMLGPDYERPEFEFPTDFREQIDAGESIVNLDWWEIFGDEVLNDLIETALVENLDLAIASARIDFVRAQLGIVRADQGIQLDGTFTGERGEIPESIAPGAGADNDFSLAVGLAYEVDLFGRLRRSTEAARAELLAAEETYRAVLVAVAADVASTYFFLREADDLRRIAEQTLATRQESTEIIRQRFNEGTVPLLDVNQAEIQEADAAAELASFERASVQFENLLSILLGNSPAAIARGRRLEAQAVPPSVPAGLPFELLDRRPDVRAAEQRLAAQTARIGVAEALRYPSLRLTSTAGLASSDLSDLTDGDASLWNIGLNLFAPLYNSGRNRRRIEGEVALTEQLMSEYELTVLQAMREIEDSLVAIRTYRDEFAAREAQTMAAQSASTQSRARYDGGVTSYLEVLDSERSLFQAQIAATAARRARLVAIVDLYKALGGGWTPEAGGS